ncbi:MAG: hypothetical protein QM635_06385, partial [Microbacteriaceae bacterium]
MIELRRGTSTARVLPEEGAVAASLSLDGRELLCATRGAGEAGRVRPLARTESDWVRAWRGGWQLCFPTAGQPDDAEPGQGFHGAASQAPWKPLARAADRLELAWEGQGLSARRRWRVHEDGLSATTLARNVGDRPARLAIAEHLVLGQAVLRGPLELEPPAGALLRPLDADGGPDGEPVPWPGEPAQRWAH